MLYRILTENLNLPDVIEIVSDSFKGFTVLQGQGYWQGQSENSLVIEIDGNEIYSDVVKVAEAIKIRNHQNVVMIQVIDSKTYFAH